jgi:hypothetical protein
MVVLQAFFVSAADKRAARLLPESAPGSPVKTTEDAICRQFMKTGATGLEPATSGVTGRYRRDRHSLVLTPNYWLEQAFPRRANRL